jgi:hypothetical protein
MHIEVTSPWVVLLCRVALHVMAVLGAFWVGHRFGKAKATRGWSALLANSRSCTRCATYRYLALSLRPLVDAQVKVTGIAFTKHANYPLDVADALNDVIHAATQLPPGFLPTSDEVETVS